MADVVMYLPDSPGTPTAIMTEEQFRQVWEPRGWARVDPAMAMVGGVLGVTAASLDDLTKPQLLEAAAALGLDVKGSDSKASIVEAIEAAAPTEPQPVPQSGPEAAESPEATPRPAGEE